MEWFVRRAEAMMEGGGVIERFLGRQPTNMSTRSVHARFWGATTPQSDQRSCGSEHPRARPPHHLISGKRRKRQSKQPVEQLKDNGILAPGKKPPICRGRLTTVSNAES